MSPWGAYLGTAVLMGIPPGDFWRMTPLEFFEVLEATEASRGVVTERARRRSFAEMQRLKRLYPDTPTAGTA